MDDVRPGAETTGGIDEARKWRDLYFEVVGQREQLSDAVEKVLGVVLVEADDGTWSVLVAGETLRGYKDPYNALVEGVRAVRRSWDAVRKREEPG